jgi:hypothetical protein
MYINHATASGMVKEDWGERGVAMGASKYMVPQYGQSMEQEGLDNRDHRMRLSQSVACSAWPIKCIVSIHSSDLQP